MELKCGRFKHYRIRQVRSNRTFMELKFYYLLPVYYSLICSNRTFMELKLNTPFAVIHGRLF